MAFDPKKLEAARQRLASKKALEDTHNEPGVTPSLLPNKSEMEQAGVDTAEAIGKTGHPILGAAAGTAVQMAPDIAMAALPMGESGEAAGVLGKAADVAFAPSISGGKAALGAAEVAKGVQALPFAAEELPKSLPEAIDFTHALADLAKKTPEDIAKVMEPAGINSLRKVIEYTMDNYLPKLPGVNKQAISRAKEVLTKAIDIAEPSLAGPREALRNAYTRKNVLSGVAKATGLSGAAAIGKKLITKGLTQ